MAKAIDREALSVANSTLENGFNWQAYLVKCAAESRIKQSKEAARIVDTSQEIDSFGKRLAEYFEAKGTKEAADKLDKCLNIGLATFSELLANTSGDERQKVILACKKVGELG